MFLMYPLYRACSMQRRLYQLIFSVECRWRSHPNAVKHCHAVESLPFLLFVPSCFPPANALKFFTYSVQHSRSSLSRELIYSHARASEDDKKHMCLSPGYEPLNFRQLRRWHHSCITGTVGTHICREWNAPSPYSPQGLYHRLSQFGRIPARTTGLGAVGLAPARKANPPRLYFPFRFYH